MCRGGCTPPPARRRTDEQRTVRNSTAATSDQNHPLSHPDQPHEVRCLPFASATCLGHPVFPVRQTIDSLPLNPSAANSKPTRQKPRIPSRPTDCGSDPLVHRGHLVCFAADLASACLPFASATHVGHPVLPVRQTINSLPLRPSAPLTPTTVGESPRPSERSDWLADRRRSCTTRASRLLCSRPRECVPSVCIRDPHWVIRSCQRAKRSTHLL
jgi:hypothetical protein